MLNRKTQIEEHKKAAELKLAARLEQLKTGGMDDKQIQKDAQVKHFRADIRQAKKQMAGVAAMERLTDEKAQAKARKAAAAKEPAKQPAKAPKSAAPKKAKKEKKAVAQEA